MKPELLFRQEISDKLLCTHGVPRKEVVEQIKHALDTMTDVYRDIPKINRRSIAIRVFRVNDGDAGTYGVGWIIDDTAFLGRKEPCKDRPEIDFYTIAILKKI